MSCCALEKLQSYTSVIRKFSVYWNSVYRTIFFFYKPWKSVRDVSKCLVKKNLQIIYYERKLCFSTVCFYLMIMLLNVLCLYVHSNEYTELCEQCEHSALESVTWVIKRRLVCMTNSVVTSVNGEFCVLFRLRVLYSLDFILAIIFFFYCINLLYCNINSKIISN